MAKTFSAVIVAAGKGERLRAGSAEHLPPKALIDWQGKPLFLRSLESLVSLTLNQVVVVIHQDYETDFRRSLSGFNHLDICLVPGGARRQDSVRLGLEALNPCDRVLVHDAARPFVSRDTLSRLHAASLEEKAVIPVLPVVETVKLVEADGYVAQTLDRSKIMRVQTPQVFDYQALLDIHRKHFQNAQEFTDDAALMEAAGYKVKTVLGCSQNIKVTTIDDLKYRSNHSYV